MRVFISIVLIFFLVGCGTVEKSNMSNMFLEVSRDTTNNIDLQVLQDRETGCQYILNSSHTASQAGASLMPRFGKDNKQICK